MHTQLFPAARRLPNTRPAAKSSVALVSGRLRAEENADYRPIIAVLNNRWRVVVCKNGIQWVLQYRRGTRLAWPLFLPQPRRVDPVRA